MTEELTEFEWVCVQAVRTAHGALSLDIERPWQGSASKMTVSCEEMTAVFFEDAPAVVWHTRDRSTATEHESQRDGWETFLREERKVWSGGLLPGEKP